MAGTGVGLSANRTPKTSSRLEAGSVLTRHDPLPAIRQGYGRSAGQRCLADPTFACKEQISCRAIDEIHWVITSIPTAAGCAWSA